MKTIIGIDLGTTYSLVSALIDGEPRVLPNVLGEVLTPSAVSVREDGEVLVGAPARARAVTHASSTAVAFKRDMGTDRTLKLGSLTMTPVQLSALVLKALKADAEAALGQVVEEAVITVPAYFGDQQRQATRDAGSLAGLKVERIINEPTAAALAYGLQNRATEQRCVVLDLGGGTFDVTVLEIIEGVIEVQSTSGDARLGGEDFDDLLTDHFVRLHAGAADWSTELEALAILRDACRRARHELSESLAARVVVPRLTLRSGRGLELEESVTRAQGNALWRPLLDRMLLPIERALSDARQSAETIDQVLLVGGATRMPCVVDLAQTRFRRAPMRGLPPDEAIALGAAVQAALKRGDHAVADVVVTDVAPFTLGVEITSRVGTRHITGLFAPIIERGTTIPCSRSRMFAPVDDEQREVQVRVFQGEHSECTKNQLLGTYRVADLPRKPAAENALEFRFTYDLNGILEIEVTKLATGAKEAFVVQQRPGALSPDALEQARNDMQRWKVHPRDLLPNTTALERADAAYVTLLGEGRELLAAGIASFKAALETQEPALIERARKELVVLTKQLRPG
jgi:molecular chaperone HscC